MRIEFNNQLKKWESFSDESNIIITDNIILPALSQKECNGKNLYGYFEFKEDDLYIKFGSAKNIFDRYSGVTGSTATERIILAWEFNTNKSHADKYIHKVLKKYAENNIGFTNANKSILNTTEAYKIESPEGLKIFIEIINKETSSDGIIKFNRAPYKDISLLVNDIMYLSKKEYKKYFNLYFAPRYGKTSTLLELIENFNERISFVCAYVKTVKTSYQVECMCNERYSNIKFIDPDTYTNKADMFKDITSWLDADVNNKILFYVALTGTSNNSDESNCFIRRTEVLSDLSHFYTFNMFIEESDFGAHCTKQINKIVSLHNKLNCKHFISTTGTGAEKFELAFTKVNSDIKFVTIKRDYLIHILGSEYRPYAVGLNWYVFKNDILSNICGNTHIMENFNAMLTVNSNNRLCGEAWFINLFRFLFENNLCDNTNILNLYNISNKSNREKARTLMNTLSPLQLEYATMIFTCNDKKSHKALKELLKSILGDKYIIQVIDGNFTTNAEAEAEAKTIINLAKKTGRKVIFIASVMANRSFSIPEIKNIILLFNDCAYSPLKQKISRGLTSINGIESYCTIIDFRLNYQFDSMLSTYLACIGTDAINGFYNKNNLDENSYLHEIYKNGKVNFYEYSLNNIEPLHRLDEPEVSYMMQTNRNFMNVKALNIFNLEYKNIKNPLFFNEDYLNEESKLNTKNVMGDGNTKRKNNSNFILDDNDSDNTTDNTSNNKQLICDEYKKKLANLSFLINHARRLDSSKYNTDIIEQEVNNMSKERKNLYMQNYQVDIETISDIVKVYKKHNYTFDMFLK